MSYVLFVWEAPVPSTLREADAIQARLAGERSPENPKHMQLVASLLRRFPCITTLPEDSDEGVWTDGPLTGRTDRPILALGVRAERADEVVPVLAEEAGKLGLVVYDMQGGRAYVPGGKVLGRAAARRKSAAPRDPTSGVGVISFVLGELRPILEASGFIKRAKGNGFVRPGEGLQQIVSLQAEAIPGGWRFRMLAPLYITEGLAVLSEAVDDWEGDYYAAGSHIERFAPFLGRRFEGFPFEGWFHVASGQHLAAAAAMMVEYTRTAVLPCLDECRTLAGLDRFLNSLPLDDSPFSGSPEFLANMLVAHLVRSPRRAALEQEIRENAPEYVQPGFRKLLDYLRTPRE